MNSLPVPRQAEQHPHGISDAPPLVSAVGDVDLVDLHRVVHRTRELIRYLDNAGDAVLLVRRARVVEDLVEEALKSCHALEEQQFELRQDAAETHLRTQRRAGELLSQTLKHRGGRPSKTDPTARVVSGAAPTLRELGVERNESHRWQRLAAIPLQDLNDHIADCRNNKLELTTKGALRLANRTHDNSASKGFQDRPSSSAALLVEYDRAKQHASEIIWLDPIALVRTMDSRKRQKEAEFVQRLRLWLDEFEVALDQHPRRAHAQPPTL